MIRHASNIVRSMVVVLAVAGVAIAGDERAEKPTSAKLITIQTGRIDIVDALRLVAEQGGLNLFIGPNVEGEVSVYLEDVPVQTALRGIVESGGYAFVMKDDVITVSRPPEMRESEELLLPPRVTRVFTLQWADGRHVKDVLEFALTQYGRIKVFNENSEPGYGGTKLSDLRDFESGVTSSTVGRTTAAGAAVSGPGGTANVEKPRNSRRLVVTETVENMIVISDLIASLDRLPPQVLIEARIVEMSTDLQRQLGIDWNIEALVSGPVLNHELPLNNRAGFAPGLSGSAAAPFGPQIRYSPDGTAHTAASLAFGTIDLSRFLGLLRIHQTDNSIRLLANPRLLVFNNHSASILVGERYPILEANITDMGTLTEAFDMYIPVGIQLEVTPSIMHDGRISMLVHPATSALGDEVIGTTGLRVRRILTREIDTRVIMRDGETIVLGGLISDRKTRTVNKVPGLGDVPILNALFRQENPSSQRVDLMIFLTAHVERAVQMTERDREIFEMYRPHFKQVDRIQDVPLHFEIPTEYEPAKPMFGDPVDAGGDEEVSESSDMVATRRVAVPVKSVGGQSFTPRFKTTPRSVKQDKRRPRGSGRPDRHNETPARTASATEANEGPN